MRESRSADCGENMKLRITPRRFLQATVGTVAAGILLSVLLAKTEKAAQSGEHELHKTAHNFDGTFHNPEWLE